MSYYKLLGLDREPFSTSPDPDFFYDSPRHYRTLLQMMIEIRLRRGLTVVSGEVGMGKTTLSRRLLQLLKQRRDIVAHIILDPGYNDEFVFLDALARTFGINLRSTHVNILDFKYAIKDYLFKMTVKNKKTVVLIIDEAQKLDEVSLEALRVLLNYETNEHKMLQLILLGQKELLTNLYRMHNMWDRVSLHRELFPFTFEETREMIGFRLRRAGAKSGFSLFSPAAVEAVYNYSRGYPRRIAMIAHEALKNLVLEGRSRVSFEDVKILSGTGRKEYLLSGRNYG